MKARQNKKYVSGVGSYEVGLNTPTSKCICSVIPQTNFYAKPKLPEQFVKASEIFNVSPALRLRVVNVLIGSTRTKKRRSGVYLRGGLLRVVPYEDKNSSTSTGVTNKTGVIGRDNTPCFTSGTGI